MGPALLCKGSYQVGLRLWTEDGSRSDARQFDNTDFDCVKQLRQFLLDKIAITTSTSVLGVAISALLARRLTARG
jgi:hypothetical protein